MEKNIGMSQDINDNSQASSHCANKCDSEVQNRIVKLKESLNLNTSVIEEAWQRLQQSLDVELKVYTVVFEILEYIKLSMFKFYIQT